jgi:hypothetical protein
MKSQSGWHDGYCMSQDRVENDTLPLTQEFLGQMLGTRRSSVSIAAGNLQKSGVIRYRRGNVPILDNSKLEKIACDCYGIIQRQKTKGLAEAQVRHNKDVIRKPSKTDSTGTIQINRRT